MAVNSAIIFQMLTEMLRNQQTREQADKQSAMEGLKISYGRDAELKRLEIAKAQQASTALYQTGMLDIEGKKIDLSDKELGLTERQIISQEEEIFKKDMAEEELLVSAKEAEIAKNFYNTLLSTAVHKAWVGYETSNEGIANQGDPKAKWDWYEGRKELKLNLGDMPETDKNLIVNRVAEYERSGKTEHKLMVELSRHFKDVMEIGIEGPKPGTMDWDEWIEKPEGKKYWEFVKGLGNAGMIFGIEPSTKGPLGIWGKDARWTAGTTGSGVDYFEKVFEELENVDKARRHIAIEGTQARLFDDFKVDVSVLSLLEGGKDWLEAGGDTLFQMQSEISRFKPGSEEYMDYIGEKLFTPDNISPDLASKYGFTYDKGTGEYNVNLPDVDYSQLEYDEMGDVANIESLQYVDLTGDIEALSKHIALFQGLQSEELSQQSKRATSSGYSPQNRAKDDWNLFEIDQVLNVLEHQNDLLIIKRDALEPKYIEQNAQKKK